jgi:flagellar protein FliS
MFAGFKGAAATYAQVDLEAKVASADPHGLIQMLFDGAIASVTQAEHAAAGGDIPGKGKATSRAIRIIDEGLRASLDKTQGGELALHLESLYNYMAQRLLLASVRNEPAGFAEVRKLLGELRGAWAQIKPAATGKPAAQPATDKRHLAAVR